MLLWKPWYFNCLTQEKPGKSDIVVPPVLGLCGKVLVAGGGYRGGCCEKLLEASPMSDKVNASGFQDGPTASQGRANQQQW